MIDWQIGSAPLHVDQQYIAWQTDSWKPNLRRVKSLFTVFISPDLQCEVTIYSFYITRPTVWSHCSQFLSHHNYSLKSLFTDFISSQLQFEVSVHSYFFLITTTIWRHCSQFFYHHYYNLKSLFTIFIASQLQL